MHSIRIKKSTTTLLNINIFWGFEPCTKQNFYQLILTINFLISVFQRQSTPNGYNGNSVSRDPISPSHNDSSDYKYGRFDASALHIAHALKQTEIQKSYNKAREKPIDSYLVSFLFMFFIRNFKVFQFPNKDPSN
jgi:hypothetical protein